MDFNVKSKTEPSTPESITNYGSLLSDNLNGLALSLGEITAFKCIRLCFGELHTIDRKFENFVGKITNGEYNIIIEQMNWNFIQDGEILISDQMDTKEIEVLWGFVQGRDVKKVSITNSRLNISLDDDIELIAEKYTIGPMEIEDTGLRWYFSKGEEWLLTYSEKENFEFSQLEA